MQKITALRHEVGIFKNNCWDSAIKYADPALLGDLLILRSEGTYPPWVGYIIKNNSNEKIVLDVAWPREKIALMINPIEISGWSILKRGVYVADNG